MADGERESNKKIHLGNRVDSVIGCVKPKAVCDTLSGVGDGESYVIECGKKKNVRNTCDERR